MEEKYFKTKEGVAEYERAEEINTQYNLDMLESAGVHLKDLKGKKVLDIGCAFGGLLNEFEKAGASCFGIDISEFAIKRCRERFPSIKAEIADSINIPFSEKFDLIVCFGTLGLVKKEEHQKTLENIYNSLSSGGRFVGNAPNAKRPYLMDIVTGRKKSASYDNARTAEEWKEILFEARFDRIRVSPVLRLPLSKKILRKNIFLKTFSGDPIEISARRN